MASTMDAIMDAIMDAMHRCLHTDAGRLDNTVKTQQKSNRTLCRSGAIAIYGRNFDWLRDYLMMRLAQTFIPFWVGWTDPDRDNTTFVT